MSLSIHPDRIPADGEATTLISVTGKLSARPAVSFEGDSRGAVIQSVEHHEGGWQARVRAGVIPGVVELRLDSPGYAATAIRFTADPDVTDSAGDGTPDALRLDDEHDQDAFRNWFVWLAEAEYFQPPAARPVEIDDCAALIRFAYRGALHRHNSAWANSSGLPELPGFETADKYQYPFTPLGASLFRVTPGPFKALDLESGVFRQFADAQTLWRRNTYLVGRDLTRALPGDLLFFRQETALDTFHGMIYVGESRVRSDGRKYVVYHTGPTRTGRNVDPGEIRRPTVEELIRFPQPEWRPVPSNPAFLGVMRWNILRRPVHESEAALR